MKEIKEVKQKIDKEPDIEKRCELLYNLNKAMDAALKGNPQPLTDIIMEPDNA